ncbi:lipid II:glycine glycyltransferase FemX [Gracilibacillus saliphilus]|uniref:lipid II:glycine glycyltransferase FemX n=1 Tax=Gracilibacillus saliphilus TaxID=543890 RepID=UPI0013D6C21D|nr:GNAT family N-acetyltransferase [Gracilibacillus saliphilus]
MLKVVTVQEEELWNDLVKSMDHFDVYQLADYVKAFKIHGDGDPLLFYYEDNEIKAINVVMKRDIALDQSFRGIIEENMFFDLSTPYGYGGFLIEGQKNNENMNQLFEEYQNYCIKHNIVSEFVRFHPLLRNCRDVENYYEVIQLGNTITVNLETEKTLWENMIGKNRNVIRKAIKSGVEIYWGRNQELYNEFIDMYNDTMDKDNAKDYYYFDEAFYNSVLKDLRYNSMIFYATIQGKIIAMSMILYANGKVHYHLSASWREYLKYAPTNLLLTEVATWGIANGFHSFHLGGGLGSGEDSLYKFKKAFNKNSDTYFSIGKKVFNNEVYEELLSMRSLNDKEAQSTDFFPAYRQ